MLHRPLLHRTLLLLGMWFEAPAVSCGQLFEFCDDFSKPRSSQRNPWNERIETERHDFTQSAVTVGLGVAQVEGGYSYFYKDTAEEIESAHTTPELMFRYGLSEDIEFRVNWNEAWVFIDEKPDRVGSEDLRYSLKLQMTRESGDSYVPTSALELRGTAPTGGNEFTTHTAQFSLDYIYQWQLTERSTIAGSTGFGTTGFADFALLPEDSSQAFNVMSQSAVLGLELTEQNTMYVEWFTILSDGLDDEFVVSVINAGVDHYLTDNLVVDIRFGKGLSEDSDDFFTGVGGGYRF
jgi:hypothetical protein